MKRLVLLPALAVVLAGCSTSQPDIDPQVRAQLIAEMARLRDASTKSDRLAAESALASLTRDIAAAQAQGRINQERARMLLQAADRVSADVATMNYPEPPAPVTVTASPPPAPDAADQSIEDQQDQPGWQELRDARRRIDEAKRKVEEQKKQFQDMFDDN